MDSSANYICSNLILQSFEKDEHTISEINSALKTFSDIVNFSSVRNDRNAKKILKFDSARSPKPSAQHLETLSELADIADFDMLNKFPLYFEPLNNYIRDSTNPRDVNREESSCFSKETKDTKYRYSTDEKQSSEGSKQSQSVLRSYLDVEWDQQLKPERVLPKISDHLLLGHRSVETQTRVLVKVLNQSNSPNMPSNGAEFVFSEDSTWPKQIGSPNKIKADISISASSTVTLSLTNKQLHIKESATEFPG